MKDFLSDRNSEPESPQDTEIVDLKSRVESIEKDVKKILDLLQNKQ